MLKSFTTQNLKVLNYYTILDDFNFIKAPTIAIKAGLDYGSEAKLFATLFS